jgi:hypothetical protein
MFAKSRENPIRRNAQTMQAKRTKRKEASQHSTAPHRDMVIIVKKGNGGRRWKTYLKAAILLALGLKRALHH